MYKVTKKTMLYVIIQLFVLVAENVVLNMVSVDNLGLWCAIASTCIVINIVIQTIGLSSEGQLFSLGGIFITFSYLIHCSYAILMALNAFSSSSAIYTVFFVDHGMSSFTQAIKYAMNGISILFIGYKIVAKNRVSSYIKDNVDCNDFNYEILKKYGYILSICFGIIYFISTIRMVMLVLQNGSYNNLNEITSSFFMSLALNLQAFFFEGLYLLMIYYKKRGNERKCRVMFVIITVALVLSFLTGARSRAIMILLVMILFWVNDIEPIKLRKLLIYVISGLLMLQLMIAVRTSRDVGFSLKGVIESFFNFEDNVFHETLNEFGSSIFVTAGFMNGYEVGHPVDFIIKELGSIIPRISAWGGEIFLSSTRRTGFEESYHLGVTYIADFYYYFGVYGQYLLALYGAWIAILDNKISEWRSKGKYIAMAVAIPGLVLVFNSVRASATLGLKMFLYSYIIFMILRVFFSKGKIGKL